MAITHTYVSAVPDDGNPNKVGSSEWNAAHTIAAQSIVTADIADANVTLGKMAANSVDASKVVDGSLTIAELSIAGALDGSHVKEGDASYANGMIPLLYAIDIDANGTGGSVAITNKLRIMNVWVEKYVNEASGGFDVRVKNAGNTAAIVIVPDSYNSAGCVLGGNFVFYEAYQNVADGAALSVSASGASNMTCSVNILGVRIP